jgi:hypothetical protein
MSSSTTSPHVASKLLRTIAPFTFVILVAVVAGALTPVGEHLLPHSIRSMANSSGPWMLIAFVSIVLSELRGWRAAAAGALSFLVMDAAFYLVFISFGDYYPHSYLAFWIGIGLLVGPAVGLSAAWLRAPGVRLRAVAVAAPAGVLIGEGVYMLIEIPGESTVYAIASVVVGVILFVILAALRLRGAATVAASSAMCVAVASAFFAVYGLIPLVLDKVVP